MRKHRKQAHKAMADLAVAQDRLGRLVHQLSDELEITRGKRRLHRHGRLIRTLHGYTWHLQALITGLDSLWPVGEQDDRIWVAGERKDA